ncbi:MAG: NADH-quinone oxidoreductase subunit N [Acidimicrobiia bacterium]|nr:NADH-quinone oxidoreductase subunit N [Acidimicrobiia bacterium]
MANGSFTAVAFETVLLVGALAVLMVAVVAGRNRSVWGPVAGFAFLAAAAAGFWQWTTVMDTGPGLFFSTPDLAIMRSPMVVMDGFSAFAAMVLGLVGFVAFLGSWDLQSRLGTRAVEFSALMLLGVAGLHMMTATPNLVVVFIGLETASIAFYIIAGFRREVEASEESALKYFLLGSLASALFLYGVALTFAATGSLTIYGANSIRDFLSSELVTDPGILLAGLGLMLIGLLFKVSAAPFHQWAPDVYQGAPTAAVGLMAAGVKVAGFAALGRIFIGGFISQIDSWAPIVAVIAALSMILGTVMALVQDDVKRMLAYSGVAHAGYLLTTLVAGPDGFPPMWFYVATYAFMLVGAFTVLSVASGPGGSSAPMTSLRAMSSRNPEMAWLMAVLMIGMAGMPFFAGFVGKVFAFVTVASAGYLWLVVVGTLTTVVGLAFYLRVVATMFVPDDDVDGFEASLTSRFAVIACAAVTLVFGVVPWPLLDVVANAFPL